MFKQGRLTVIEEIQRFFRQVCSEAGRKGVIGFSSVDKVRLLPEQRQYLQAKLNALGSVQDITAVSLGLLYHESEVLAIPASWRGKLETDDRWDDYARAYHMVNDALNRVAAVLAERFGGVAEQATVAGWAGKVKHVMEYFPHCVSHRAFAEAAGLGWRGRHGLIVTAEGGPALRLATLFIPGSVSPEPRGLAGCGDCRACLDVCPILHKGGDYRDTCRRRINGLHLRAEVCGICVRVCWERNRSRQV